MFKLKPGNVFEKMNKMNRKQAYTLGAIVIVFLIALISLASFMGKADDESFDNLNARGYDLAQMPFVSDEAEQYLLASKYPDMQNNGATVLYSAQEKEERQAEDAEAEGEEETTEEVQEESYSSYDNSSYSSSSSRGYRGRSRGGSSAPTQVGSLGSASMGRASGSGVGGSWGAPRGDFSPYRSQDKGREKQMQPQPKDKSARQALYQMRRGSQAAAGLQDGKLANAKKALVGANITGQEAFTDNGIDLSKADGLNLDTNAPSSSGDLSNLDDKINDAANDAKKKDDKNKEALKDQLLKQLYSGLLNLGLNLVTNIANQSVDLMMADAKARVAANQEAKAAGEAKIDNLINAGDVSKLAPGSQEYQDLQKLLPGTDLSKVPSGTSVDHLLQMQYNPEYKTAYESAQKNLATTQRMDEMNAQMLNVGMMSDGKTQKSFASSASVDRAMEGVTRYSNSDILKAMPKQERRNLGNWYETKSAYLNANLGNTNNYNYRDYSNNYNWGSSYSSGTYNADDFYSRDATWNSQKGVFELKDKYGNEVSMTPQQWAKTFGQNN